jgi:hypothetical protein
MLLLRKHQHQHLHLCQCLVIDGDKILVSWIEKREKRADVAYEIEDCFETEGCLEYLCFIDDILRGNIY